MSADSLPPDHKEQIINECNKAEQWPREKMQQQDTLPKTSDPVQTNIPKENVGKSSSSQEPFLFVAFFLEDSPLLNCETPLALGSTQPSEAPKFSSAEKFLDLLFPLIELLTGPFWAEAPPLPNCPLKPKITNNST
ncbi:hypothetical protein Ahy_B07g088663 isoform C [Arachis hypogaea]|uniref:Uncharacterized protein n=1 Tax=Arachis hypogaea TaxID=3818 RepID=A0A444YF41_ARAHY|nr:hypothetical protein Ahy_B07g088663 isoform C [Arachis hypogaea]